MLSGDRKVKRSYFMFNVCMSCDKVLYLIKALQPSELKLFFSALCNINTTVKMEVIHLLAAMSMYSEEGREIAIRVVEFCKVT